MGLLQGEITRGDPGGADGLIPGLRVFGPCLGKLGNDSSFLCVFSTEEEENNGVRRIGREPWYM